VLTAAEIAAVYAAQTGDMRAAIMALDPIAYWMLDEDSGTTAASEYLEGSLWDGEDGWAL
jgi:hypothetical protein